MAKRKKSKKKQSSSKVLSYIAWALALIALALSSLLIGYYLGYSSAEEKTGTTVKKTEELRKLPKKPVVQNVKKRLKEVLKKESKNYNSASHEIENEALVNPPKTPL